MLLLLLNSACTVWGPSISPFCDILCYVTSCLPIKSKSGVKKWNFLHFSLSLSFTSLTKFYSRSFAFPKPIPGCSDSTSNFPHGSPVPNSTSHTLPFFLNLILIRSSLCIHMGLLPPLLFLSRASSHGILPSRSLNRLKPVLNSRVVMLLFACFPPLRILNFNISLLLHPGLQSVFTRPISFN